MAFPVNIKTLQYDSIYLSKLSEELKSYLKTTGNSDILAYLSQDYVNKSLANLGQRFGDKGDGFYIKNITVKELLGNNINYTSDSVISISNNKIYLYDNIANALSQTTGSVLCDDLSVINFDELTLDNITITNVNISIDNGIICISFMLDNNSFTYNVYYGDDSQISNFDGNVTYNDNITEINSINYSFDDENNVYYSDDNDVKSIIELFNDNFTIVKNIITYYNETILSLNLNDDNNVYIYKLLFNTICESVNNTLFNDITYTANELSNGKDRTVIIPIDYEFSCLVSDSNIFYLTIKQIGIKFLNDDISEEYLVNDKNNFIYVLNDENENIPTTRSVHYIYTTKDFNFSQAEDTENVNILDYQIIMFEPFISIGDNGTWYIDNIDTTINANGINAGQPNLIITYTTYGTKSDGTSGPIGKYLAGASSMQGTIESMSFSVFESANIKQYWSYNDALNNNETTKTFVFGLPDFESYSNKSANNKTILENAIFLCISDCYKVTSGSKTTYYALNSTTSAQTVDIKPTGINNYVTSFWKYSGDSDELNKYENILINNESLNLYHLTNIPNIFTYINNRFNNNTPVNKYQFSAWRGENINYKYKNSDSSTFNAYPNFRVYDTIPAGYLTTNEQYDSSGYISTCEYVSFDAPEDGYTHGYYKNAADDLFIPAIHNKFIAGFLIDNTRYELEDKYLYTYLVSSSKWINQEKLLEAELTNTEEEERYNYEFDTLDVPTLSFAEVLTNNVNILNRLNILGLKPNKDNKLFNALYYAYFGLNLKRDIKTIDEDKVILTLGTDTINNDLGTNSLIDKEYRQLLKKFFGLEIDFNETSFTGKVLIKDSNDAVHNVIPVYIDEKGAIIFDDGTTLYLLSNASINNIGVHKLKF